MKIFVAERATAIFTIERTLVVPTIIRKPRIRKWQRLQPQASEAIVLEDEQEYPGWYKPIWRVSHKKGQQQKFLRSFTNLELVLAQSKLEQAASWAVWRAIYVNQECFYPYGRAKELSLTTLAAGTGFSESSVQLAIAELQWRNMIEVFQSEGWKKPKAYGTNSADVWLAPR